jgi:hypothetical protein
VRDISRALNIVNQSWANLTCANLNVPNNAMLAISSVASVWVGITPMASYLTLTSSGVGPSRGGLAESRRRFLLSLMNTKSADVSILQLLNSMPHALRPALYNPTKDTERQGAIGLMAK